MASTIGRNSAVEAATPVDNDDNACCMCMETISRSVDEPPQMQRSVLPCSHEFHFECISMWSKRGDNLCPLCKGQCREIRRQDGHIERVADKAQGRGHGGATEEEYEEDGDISYFCDRCGSDESDDLLLLCDSHGCEGATHTFCLGLTSIPTGDWYCDLCRSRRWDESIARTRAVQRDVAAVPAAFITGAAAAIAALPSSPSPRQQRQQRASSQQASSRLEASPQSEPPSSHPMPRPPVARVMIDPVVGGSALRSAYASTDRSSQVIASALAAATPQHAWQQATGMFGGSVAAQRACP